jgi:hypothetical protein
VCFACIDDKTLHSRALFLDRLIDYGIQAISKTNCAFSLAALNRVPLKANDFSRGNFYGVILIDPAAVIMKRVLKEQATTLPEYYLFTTPGISIHDCRNTYRKFNAAI